jgi:putative tryptophan/tyrosine transport system substrate-binding protein
MPLPHRYYAVDGGLTAYSPDQLSEFRQAAYFVDRILRGEKPGDLPVQTPNKYELVINLKTAKALGAQVILNSNGLRLQKLAMRE